MSKEAFLAICLILAAVVYVIIPLCVKGYHVDPAFSGILTGIIGLSQLAPSRKEKNAPEDDPTAE